MPSEQETENGGLLRSLRQLHKTLTRIELVIFPIIVAVGVAVGFYRPIVGFGVVGIMLFFTWIYFDAKKHQNIHKSQNLKDSE